RQRRFEDAFGLSMRVVPRMIKIIRPGIQKCIPGFSAYKQSQKASQSGRMLAYRNDCDAF
ncbi:MAG: hypothetical protein K2M22_09000, partial [Lachnospiraceae bacterium]|nr:hypothetical protein [Lachnospiraceae bacterium]